MAPFAAMSRAICSCAAVSSAWVSRPLMRTEMTAPSLPMISAAMTATSGLIQHGVCERIGAAGKIAAATLRGVRAVKPVRATPGNLAVETAWDGLLRCNVQGRVDQQPAPLEHVEAAVRGAAAPVRQPCAEHQREHGVGPALALELTD